MAKINITKPTGTIESLNLLSAFKAENNTYVVLDSEKMGSMGLPIIYVSKYTNKLEKINDTNEWQGVKNYLKGIISGTNFEYVKIGDNVNADEAYYTPLTLPAASFDVIKSRYVVEDNMNKANEMSTISEGTTTPVMPNTNTVSNTTVNVSPIAPNMVNQTPTEPQGESVMNLIDEAYKVNSTPVNPTSNQASESVQPINNIPPVTPTPTVNTPAPMEQPNMVSNNDSADFKPNTMNFENDKETFLKACENMFDALISKYQKELSSLERKEQELKRKEAEINGKLQAANEHLANAEAREQVENIAHDNAQKVMDLSSFMPTNPNNNQ